MTKSIKKRCGVAIASAAMCVGVVGPISQASAEETDKPALSAQAWFWSSNRRFTFSTKDPVLGVQPKFDVAAGGVVGFVPGGGISPISIGHLGISMVNGSSDMRSYARWDLGDVPQGSKIKSFVVEFTLSRSTPEHLEYHLEAEARVPSTLAEDVAKVDACPVTETLTSSEAEPSSSFSFQRPEIENQSTDINRRDQRLEPLYDCGQGRIRGELSVLRDKLVFDLTTLAQKWVDDPLSNNGVALIGASEGVTTTWMLELHGAEYSARVDVGLPVGAPVPLPEAPQGEPNHYVSKADAPKAAIAYNLPDPEPVDEGGSGGTGGGETIVIQEPGQTNTVVVQQPGITTTQTIYAMPNAGGSVPVGDVSTPGWVFLGLPIGFLFLRAMMGAIAGDDLALAGAPTAGSRVANLLRQRRLDA